MMNGGARIPRDSRRRLPAPPIRRGDGLRCSPGARYVSERLTGRWLVSLIVSHQQDQHFAQVGRQSWRLERRDIGRGPSDASLTCADAEGRILLSLTIRTDFPSPGVELLIRDGCLFLPSEDWGAPHSPVRRVAAVPGRLAATILRSLRRLAESNAFLSPPLLATGRFDPASRGDRSDRSSDQAIEDAVRQNGAAVQSGARRPNDRGHRIAASPMHRLPRRQTSNEGA